MLQTIAQRLTVANKSASGPDEQRQLKLTGAARLLEEMLRRFVRERRR